MITRTTLLNLLIKIQLLLLSIYLLLELLILLIILSFKNNKLNYKKSCKVNFIASMGAFTT